MVKLVYEVIQETSEKKTKKEKLEFLKTNESWALKDVLRGALDESITWLIPAGSPPYTPAQGHNSSSNLLRQNIQFSYFVKGGKGDQIMKAKREQIYITLLESIHPKDAELVVAMMSRKIPYKGITKELVKEAFPDLIRS